MSKLKDTDTYYVYKLVSPSNKIYIGITSRDPKTRWRKGQGYAYNKHLKNAIDKYGWNTFDKEILHEGLTKDEACELEIYYIKLYNCKEPNGYNRSDGGENPAQGIKHTYETRQKISRSLKGKMAGEKNPMYGIHKNNITDSDGHLPLEIRDKISEKQKQRMQDDKYAFFMQSFNEKKKRKVNQYDLNGNFIKQWGSRNEVEQTLGICAQTIHKVCMRVIMKNGGRCLTAGGFQWRFADDCDDIGICIRNQPIKKPIKINQYSLSGKYLATFDSMGQAQRLTGIHKSNISRAIKKQSVSGGYLWQLFNGTTNNITPYYNN